MKQSSFKDHMIFLAITTISCILLAFTLMTQPKIEPIEAEQSEHVCIDREHVVCDAGCSCDGLGCPEIVNIQN